MFRTMMLNGMKKFPIVVNKGFVPAFLVISHASLPEISDA